MTPFIAQPRRPSRPPSELIPTRERVLRAAEDEFGAHGFRHGRLTDIATRAETSRSTLMYHYESKQILYTAVIRHAARRLDEVITFASLGREPADVRLTRTLAELVSFIEARPSLARLAMREILGVADREPVTLLAAVSSSLAKVEELMRPYAADDVPLRDLLLQFLGGVVFAVVGGPPADLAARALLTAEHTFRGVLEAARASRPDVDQVS